MTANEIIKEHRHRVETLEAERKICGISSYRQRLEDLLDKLRNNKPLKTFADIRYAALEQELIYDNIMHKVTAVQNYYPDNDVFFCDS